MDTSVCHSNPVRWAVLLIAFSSFAGAQTWRKLGNSAVERGLAGPAGGPVLQTWFSEEGDRLFARTSRGNTFVTTDFDNWTLASADAVRRESPLDRSPAQLPEARMSLRQGAAGRLYALGANVHLSDDGGRNWINVTSFNGSSVIGEGQHDLAVSPRDPLFIAVANDAGVWVSHDGGLSWSGLNENLPNLPVRALLASNRVSVDRIGAAQFVSRSGWVSIPGERPDFRPLSLILNASITALAGAGDFWYAGAADGRIWTSADAKAHWNLSTARAAGPVERFAVDPDAPRIAFAAASGPGAHVLRTVNGGQTWDDLTGALADAPLHGIAIDRAGGAVYAATDRGLFLSRMDVNAIGIALPWVNVSATLPANAAVQDVRLEGARLTVAVDGWGVYVTRAPHLAETAKLLNAADFSTRAAAPGGLLSAMGIAVESAFAAGRSLPVLAKSQIQIPFETAPSELQVELNRTLRVGVTVKAVSPAVFVDRDGAPLLLDPDTGMMLDGSQAALARSSVQLLATGLGKVTPEWPSGTAAPSENVPAVVADVRAYLNGISAEVVKATLAPGYVGMYLVEIRIPALLDAGTADLYLSAGGETSNHVRLTVTY